MRHKLITLQKRKKMEKQLQWEGQTQLNKKETKKRRKNECLNSIQDDSSELLYRVQIHFM